MNKEIKAKVEEFVKEYGKRELSMDELDKVSGGATGNNINGVWMTEEDFYNIAHLWTDQFGYDIAADMFCELTGMCKNEINGTRRGGESEHANIDFLVYRYMQILDNSEKKGYSY